jgi:hypothetical protein
MPAVRRPYFAPDKPGEISGKCPESKKERHTALGNMSLLLFGNWIIPLLGSLYLILLSKWPPPPLFGSVGT